MTELTWADYDDTKTLQEIAEAAGYARGVQAGRAEKNAAHNQHTRELVADHVKACVQIKRLIEAVREGPARCQHKAQQERLVNAIENAEAFLRGDL